MNKKRYLSVEINDMGMVVMVLRNDYPDEYGQAVLGTLGHHTELTLGGFNEFYNQAGTAAIQWGAEFRGMTWNDVLDYYERVRDEIDRVQKEVEEQAIDEDPDHHMIPEDEIISDLSQTEEEPHDWEPLWGPEDTRNHNNE